MLSFLKRIFGAKPAEPTAVPYKVEATEHFPFPKAFKEEKPAVKVKPPAAKRPASKKTVAKKTTS